MSLKLLKNRKKHKKHHRKECLIDYLCKMQRKMEKSIQLDVTTYDYYYYFFGFKET